jgi:hypothetical protein
MNDWLIDCLSMQHWWRCRPKFFPVVPCQPQNSTWNENVGYSYRQMVIDTDVGRRICGQFSSNTQTRLGQATRCDEDMQREGRSPSMTTTFRVILLYNCNAQHVSAEVKKAITRRNLSCCHVNYVN